LAIEEAPSRGYYDQFRSEYADRRSVLLAGLAAAGFEVFPPEGTYFVMADYTALDEGGADAFVRRLIEERGVAAIPPTSFYDHPEHAAGLVRFAFCKRLETLRAAAQKLAADSSS
jgi:aspartate/methionine/tyrosine aminotransferase